MRSHLTATKRPYAQISHSAFKRTVAISRPHIHRPLTFCVRSKCCNKLKPKNTKKSYIRHTENAAPTDHVHSSPPSNAPYASTLIMTNFISAQGVLAIQNKQPQTDKTSTSLDKLTHASTLDYLRRSSLWFHLFSSFRFSLSHPLCDRVRLNSEAKTISRDDLTLCVILFVDNTVKPLVCAMVCYGC